ncbi:hypothetical protein GGP46_003035 [Salinibacter ruber]|nr:hypothetical protein [Salinibacter ruber]
MGTIETSYETEAACKTEASYKNVSGYLTKANQKT